MRQNVNCLDNRTMCIKEHQPLCRCANLRSATVIARDKRRRNLQKQKSMRVGSIESMSFDPWDEGVGISNGELKVARYQRRRRSQRGWLFAIRLERVY
jgi:hypothetical protein